MKKVAFLILLFLSIRSFAMECGMNGMTFYPLQREISLNSMFIIQGYFMSEKTVDSFGDNRDVFLVSVQGDSIKLSLKRIIKGQMSLTQAIFKPEKSLNANTTYFLRYSNQSDSETREMRKWNSKKKVHEKVFWRTSDTKELPPINPNLKIDFLKTEVIPYGCGPEANAIFEVSNKSQSEIWYKTEVMDTKTGKSKIYYISEWQGKLNVGHGMCAGAFTFKRKSNYKVRFTPMNTDGKALKTTQWIEFKNPYDNYKSPFGN